MKSGNKTPFKKAAALKYDPQKGGAPVLTAAGKGLVAERIVDKAVENEVPVIKDDGLADILARLPLDREIPPALYRAVAEILVFISRIDGEFSNKP